MLPALPLALYCVTIVVEMGLLALAPVLRPALPILYLAVPVPLALFFAGVVTMLRDMNGETSPTAAVGLAVVIAVGLAALGYWAVAALLCKLDRAAVQRNFDAESAKYRFDEAEFRRMWHGITARTVIGTAVAAVLLAHAAGLFDTSAPPDEAIVPEPSGSTLVVKGMITTETKKSFSRALVKILATTPSSEPLRIELDSEGGMVMAMKDMIDLLKGLPPDRTIVTEVRDDGVCASACVPLWLAGQERKLPDSARLMIHEETLGVLTSSATTTILFHGSLYLQSRVRSALWTSEARKGIQESSPSLDQFAEREGVWHWWNRRDCWLSGADINTSFPALLKAERGLSEPPAVPTELRCRWTDPNDKVQASK
ncbi:ATP-dependent Clp protease proteolytic subunit [Azospirillum sp. sgz302134]